MSIEIQSVQRLRVSTEASFATDRTGDLASNFTDVPFVEGSLQMVNDVEMLNPMYAQQFKDGHPTQLTGLKACTLSYSLNLASTGTAAVSGTTAVQGALGQILKEVLGGESLAAGTTVSSATDAATLTATTTAVISTGCALGWVNSAGDLEARPVRQVPGSSRINMRMAFSATASASDILYRSATYHLGEDPTGSLQHLIQGEESDDAWLQLGQQIEGMSLDVPVGQLPKITFNFKGAQYLTNTSTTGTITGSLTAATYTNVSPSHFVGGVHIANYDSSSPTELHVSSITINPAVTYVPQTSPGGTNTIKRWVRNRVAPVVSGSFVVPYEDLTHWIDRDAETRKQLIVQIGTSAGSTVLLDFPTIQITNVQRNGGDAIASSTVEWVAQRDDRTVGNTDLNKSAFRIHLL